MRPNSTPAFDLDLEAGLVTYRSVVDGYVDRSDARDGSFVPNGHQMAVIVADGERAVEAEFLLDPVDFGHIEEGAQARIFLPDNSVIDGQIGAVNIVEQDGQFKAKVTVKSDALAAPEREAIVRLNTPVLVVMELRDDGILAGPTQSLMEFFARIGLR